MKIILLGDFSADLDEGYKSTSYHLAKELRESGDDVVPVNIKRIWLLDQWLDARSITPQIIHTIAQPTNGSISFTHLLRKFWPRASTVLSALRPDNYFKDGRISSVQRELLKRSCPDLILVQDLEAMQHFNQVGCVVKMLPGGVDLARFSPPSVEEKRALRRKYNLDVDKPVVLHVGHLRAERNLSSLELLPESGIQVVVVGSLYMKSSQSLINELKTSGVTIIAGYQPDIENYFKLADCYIFPVFPGNSLSMPLSVLEAMACNLRVITTPFPGLVNAFDEGHGLTFIRNPTREAMRSEVRDILSTAVQSKTRQMVDGYSWEAVTGKLRQYYQGLALP